MTFRNRKINHPNANKIAKAMSKDTLTAYQAEQDKVSSAETALERALANAMQKCDAHERWSSLSVEKRKFIVDEMKGWGSRNVFRWVDEMRVECTITKGDTPMGAIMQSRTFTVEVSDLGFYFLARGAAESDLGCFLPEDEAAKWNAYAQAAEIVRELPEASTLMDAMVARDEARDTYGRVQDSLYATIIGRSTKEVIETWPDAESIIHANYYYLPSTGQKAVMDRAMPNSMAEAIEMAMTPAIEMAAE